MSGWSARGGPGPHPQAAALLAAALGLAGLAAGAPALGATLEDAVLQHLQNALGAVPATLLVDGREEPTAQALAPLREFPLGMHAALPSRDLGLAYRVGPGECLFAGIVVAEAWGSEPMEAMVNEQQAGAANYPLDLDSSLQCQPGGALQPYMKGVLSAEVAPAAASWYACLPSGGFWLDQNPGCHVQDFRNVTVAGHVGKVDITNTGGCCPHYHLEMLFCGVRGHTPDFAGDRDACPVLLERAEPPLPLPGP